MERGRVLDARFLSFRFASNSSTTTTVTKSHTGVIVQCSLSIRFGRPIICSQQQRDLSGSIGIASVHQQLSSL